MNSYFPPKLPHEKKVEFIQGQWFGTCDKSMVLKYLDMDMMHVPRSTRNMTSVSLQWLTAACNRVTGHLLHDVFLLSRLLALFNEFS